MKALSRSQSIVSVILGMAALGSIGIFVRQTDQAIPPITQSLGRIFVSFIFIALYILLTNRRRLKISKTDISKFILAGFVGITIMAIAFTLAVLKTTIANTYFLLYTAPVFVAILGYLFLKEKITLKILVAIGLSLLGTLLLFNPTGLQRHLLGNFFGLLTGLSYAVYIVTAKKMSKKYRPPTITLWTTLFGVVGLLVATAVLEYPFNASQFISGMLPIAKAGFLYSLAMLCLMSGCAV